MATELATGYVSIVPETKGLGRDLNKQLAGPLEAAGKKGSGKLNQSLAGVAAGVGRIGGAIAAAGITAGLMDASNAASDLNETVNKSSVVFGEASDGVMSFAEDSAKSFGMSKRLALEYAATFGNLFVSMGMAQQKSADMSTSLVKLAADLASFNNANPEDALLALRAGLVGEIEPLRRFGVNLNEAVLGQEAMRLGLAKTGDTLAPAVKAQAAYSIILKQTKTAQGDFARTSDDLANSQRTLNAEWEDAKAKLGQSLIPAMKDATHAASGMLGVYNDMSESQKASLYGWARQGTYVAAGAKLLGGWGAAAGLAAGASDRLGMTIGDGLANSIGNAVTNNGDLREMYYLTSSGSSESTQAVSGLATAQDAMAVATDGASGSIAAQIRDMHGLMTAADSLAGRTRTAKDAELDWKSAVLDAKGADAEVNQLRRDGKTNTDEYARALIAAESAHIRLNDSTQVYREEQHAANLSLVESAAGTKNLTRDQQGLADKLNAATDKVAGLKAKLETVPKSKRSEVKAEIKSAEANVKTIKAKIASIKGRRVDVTIDFHADFDSNVARIFSGAISVKKENVWNEAYGDIIPATAGGVHVRAAERGLDEAFIPIENSNRSWQLVAATVNGMLGGRAVPMQSGGGTVVFHVPENAKPGRYVVDTASQVGGASRRAALGV